MTRPYAALDVSDKSTHLCVVDEAGAVTSRGVCATDPQVVAEQLNKRCPEVARVVLETARAFGISVSRSGGARSAGLSRDPAWQSLRAYFLRRGQLRRMLSSSRLLLPNSD